MGIRHPWLDGYPMEGPPEPATEHDAVADLGMVLVDALYDADEQDVGGLRPPYRQIARRVRRGVTDHDRPVRAGWWLGTAWEMARGARPVATAIDELARVLALADPPTAPWGLQSLQAAVGDAVTFLNGLDVERA